jgi:hypothetical protein
MIRTITDGDAFEPKMAPGRPDPVDATAPVAQVRPLYRVYNHTVCGRTMRISDLIATRFACDPGFYNQAYCRECEAFFPISGFHWTESPDGRVVGT